MAAFALLFFLPLLLSGLDKLDAAKEVQDFREREEDPEPDPDPNADLITLTQGDDLLVGTGAAEDITALAGDDAIAARGGDDVLRGGSGSDVLRGERGADQLIGGDGNDVIAGNRDDDALFGEVGRDVLLGGAGNDILSGGAWSDFLEGGAGGDTLSGGFGNDTLVGGKYLDRDPSFAQLQNIRDGNGKNVDGLPTNVTDDSTSDTLAGGNGNDLLILGTDDLGFGGEGDDTFAVLAEDSRGTGGTTIILDFDPSQDAVAITVPDILDGPVEIETQQAASSTNVSVNGEVIATLRGVAASDLSGSNFFLIETDFNTF